MTGIRAYHVAIAKEYGEKSAQFIHQLNYWLTRPKIGYMVDGKKYIKNTYNQWIDKSNFPHWTTKTVQRIVEKLKEAGVIEVDKIKKREWDHTLFYTLNYSHPILASAGYGRESSSKPSRTERGKPRKSEVSDRNRQNVQTNNNTYTTPKTTSNTYGVGKQLKPTGKKGIVKKEYREEYKKASVWLKNRSKEFKKEVRKYVDLHCNRPSTAFPMALKQKIVAEIWKKFTEQDHCTDFEFIDKEKYRELVCNIPEPEDQQCSNLESEMMRLYESGGYYGNCENRANA